MKKFEYVNAKTLDSAMETLAELKEQAMLVAGGTNVVVNINNGKRNNRTLVNIREIMELAGIYNEGETLRIGALTTIDEISKSDQLKKYAPGLYHAGNVFADPTTRHSATIGGNVANAGAGGDTIPSLLVLNASVTLKSLRGERIVPIRELFTGPGRTVIAPDELITYFTFKPEPQTSFIKLSMRKAMSISIVGCAAYVLMDGEKIRDCRIALGAIAPTPVRAYHAETALIGGGFDEETMARMAQAVQKDMNPRDISVRATGEYRRAVTPELVERAMRLAAYGDCENGRRP